MSKIRTLTLTVIFFLILLLGSKKINAATPIEACPNPVQATATNSKTIATNLTNASENAKFEVNLGKFYDPSVAKWQIRFECAVVESLQQSVSATANSELKTISSESVNRSRIPGGGCEFFAGTQTLQVIGDDTPRCRGTYVVQDADSKCKLTITPPTGIIISKPIQVSGETLTDNGQFNLFIDNDDKFSDYVITPKFPNREIPKTKLSPTTHIVYLRRDLDPYSFWKTLYQSGGPLASLVALKMGDKLYGSRLCPIQFTVGSDADHAGSVITNGEGTIPATPCTDEKCSKGGGDPCIDNANRGPAFKTAIGCVHTNPAEFVKDLMTWVLGIGGGLAFLMMLLGAFQMLTSAGNPETLNAGKDRLTNAVIGLLLVIFSILLLQIIGVGILNIPRFSK